jgi:small conductance mechanosensitive channel
MKPYPSYLTFLILLFSLCISSTYVVAQDAMGEDESDIKVSPEVLAQESNTTISEINDLYKTTEDLRSYAKEMVEGDRFLYMNLISTIEEKLRVKLDRLMEIKTSLSKNEVYADLNLQAIKTIVKQQSTILQKEIKTVSKIAIKIRNKKSKQDLVFYALNRTETKMDFLISDWHKNIQLAIALDMEVDEENNNFTQLLQFRSIGIAGRIRIMLDATNVLNDRLNNATEEQQKHINQQLYNIDLRKTEAAVHLESMVDLMAKQGLETTEFGKVLIVSTGKILSENVDTKAVVGIFQAALNNAMIWWKDNFPLIMFRIISFVLILLAFKMLAGLVGRFVNKLTTGEDNNSSKLLNNFFRTMVSKTVMVIGFAVALSQLGIEIGPLLAGMGVMGFVVGFALQDTLSNFASGMMILIYKPYDVGDFVNVSGISGQVKDMNLVSTTILTIDHQRMVIPNSKIWGGIITNVTAESLRRVDMVFSIGYTDNLDKAETVLHKMMDQHQLILDDPKPVIKVHTLGASSVDFIVRPWVNSKDYWDVYWDITRQVKEEFDMAGISIPYPQQDIHLYPASGNS